MQPLSFVLALASGLWSVALAASSPPPGAITVGKGGKYATLAQALKDTSSNEYFIFGGKYTGQVSISRANIKIYGQTSNALSYTSNNVTFTDNVSKSEAGTDAQSATIRVLASGVSLYNLNIANTYGKPAEQSQAIALSVEQGQFGAYGCKITGYQDTLLAESGAQFYGRSYIEGAVDFIFGQRSSIWITKSTINSVGDGAITASGRSSNDPNYYVIDHSTIQGKGKVFLGRPWRDYARVVFQNNEIGSQVQAAGWEVWSSTDPNTDHVFFGEYNNHGAGALKKDERVKFATNMTQGVSIDTVLGSNYASWVNKNYM